MQVFLIVAEIVLAVFGFCFGVACSVLEINRRKAMSFWAKMIASLCFLLIGFINALRSPNGAYAVLMVAGLFYGFAGDAYLAAPAIAPGRPFVYQGCGAVSFLLGHVLYIVAMIRHFGISVWAFLAASALLAGVFFWTRSQKIDAGPLFIPGIIYMSSCCLTAGMAIHVLITDFSAFSVLLALGGLLFVLSDTVLILRRFGQNKKSLLLHYGVLMTYYPAQSLFAMSMLFLNY